MQIPFPTLMFFSMKRNFHLKFTDSFPHLVVLEREKEFPLKTCRFLLSLSWILIMKRNLHSRFKDSCLILMSLSMRRNPYLKLTDSFSHLDVLEREKELPLKIYRFFSPSSCSWTWKETSTENLQTLFPTFMFLSTKRNFHLKFADSFSLLDVHGHEKKLSLKIYKFFFPP